MKNISVLLAWLCLPLFAQLPQPYYPNGPSEISNATQLQSVKICTGTPSDTQLLAYSAANSCWQAGPYVFSQSASPKNTSVGVNALTPSATGLNNVAMGEWALYYLTSGGQNAAFGYSALNDVTTASDSSAFGYSALTAATGGNNTAFGAVALYSDTSGAQNTAAGVQAGYGTSATNANVSGSDNTFLGYQAAPGSATQQNYMTVIGAGATGVCSGCVVLGRSTDITEVGAVAFASLPAVPAAGSFIYCTNCTTAATCTSGGSGHMAVSNGSAFTCQ